MGDSKRGVGSDRRSPFRARTAVVPIGIEKLLVRASVDRGLRRRLFGGAAAVSAGCTPQSSLKTKKANVGVRQAYLQKRSGRVSSSGGSDGQAAGCKGPPVGPAQIVHLAARPDRGRAPQPHSCFGVQDALEGSAQGAEALLTFYFALFTPFRSRRKKIGPRTLPVPPPPPS